LRYWKREINGEVAKGLPVWLLKGPATNEGRRWAERGERWGGSPIGSSDEAVEEGRGYSLLSRDFW